MEQNHKGSTTLFCDNKSAISMAKNPVFHSRTKHIDVKYNFIREAVENGVIEIKYCSTQNQMADIFTKALSIEKFLQFRDMMKVQRQNIKGEC